MSLSRSKTALAFTLLVLGPVLQDAMAFAPSLFRSAAQYRPLVRPASCDRKRGTALELVDPSDAADHITSAVNHIHTLANLVGGPGDNTASAETTQGLAALLSTTYSDVATASNHGSFFGVPFGARDPYFNGMSIPPRFDPEDVKEGITAATSSLSAGGSATASAGDVPILDLSQMTIDRVMPGFRVPGGLPPANELPISEELTKGELEMNLRQADIISRLPNAALVFVLIDFFLVSPGIDVYKEDIEDERSEIVIDKVGGLAIRFALLMAIGFATIWISNMTYHPAL